VTIFSTAKDEKVVSVERITEPEADDEVIEAADVTEGEGAIAPTPEVTPTENGEAPTE